MSDRFPTILYCCRDINESKENICSSMDVAGVDYTVTREHNHIMIHTDYSIIEVSNRKDAQAKRGSRYCMLYINDKDGFEDYARELIYFRIIPSIDRVVIF